MSRILDYVLEPSVVYTNGSFLVKVKVQDDYKYKKLLVSESMKYTTATGTTYTLTNAVSTNNASILKLEGNTTQNGTPTPTNPIPIYTVSGDNNIVVSNEQHVTGNSYRVDFGGDNKLPQDKYIASTEINGITYTNNGDGTFSLSGTATANTTIRIIPVGDLSLKTSQAYYLYSSQPYNSTSFNMSVVLNDSGTNRYLTANSTLTTPSSFTQARLQFYIASGNTVNVQNIKLMLVEGNTAPSRYSPYVSNPIELCKIGNYVDKLKRAEGNNKFNDILRNGVTNYQTGAYSSSTNRLTSTEWTVLPAGTYTFNAVSTTGKTLYVSNITFDTSDNFLNIPNFSGQWLELPCTFTLTQDIKWKINIRDSNYGNISSTEVIKVMLNEGSTALPYEPYGTDWYIEKNIGKAKITSSLIASFQNVKTLSKEARVNKSAINCKVGYTVSYFCNTFQPVATTWNNDQIGIMENAGTSGETIAFRIPVDSDNTFFDTYDIILYYQLANPTYEVITNTNLIEQLNNLQDIILQPSLCYVDWVGEEKPTMTLQYPTNETLNAYITTEDNKLIRTDWGV